MFVPRTTHTYILISAAVSLTSSLSSSNSSSSKRPICDIIPQLSNSDVSVISSMCFTVSFAEAEAETGSTNTEHKTAVKISEIDFFIIFFIAAS